MYLHGDKTEARGLRSSIRHRLGTSREDCPSGMACLRAAQVMSRLLWLASGRKISLRPVLAAPSLTPALSSYKPMTITWSQAMHEIPREGSVR